MNRPNAREPQSSYSSSGTVQYPLLELDDGNAGKDGVEQCPSRLTGRRRVRRRRRRRLLLILAVLAVIVFGGRTALSYYVDVLWFGSLGYGDVFWKTLSLQSAVFAAFAAATFLILYGSFLALKRAHLADLPSSHTIFIGGQPVKLPVEPVLRLVALGVSLVIAAVTGAGMMAEWPTLALLLVRTAHRGWRGGSDLRQAAELLSVHPARVAAHRRLAADAGGDYLCARRFLHPHHGRNPCACRTSRQLRPIAVARVLHRVCVPAADPRDARVSRPLRAIVRGSHDLRRCDLHGRARHAYRHCSSSARRSFSAR